MLSWGIAYWLLTDLLEDNPIQMKRIFMVSIVAWFVADSLGSIAAGGWVNVVFNVDYLLMFVLPRRRITESGSRYA